jgi:hypothetical protein
MQRILNATLDSIGLAGLQGESSNPVEYRNNNYPKYYYNYFMLGISLPELWTLLESELQFTIDDFMKNWIWQQIRTSNKLEYFLSDKVQKSILRERILARRNFILKTNCYSRTTRHWPNRKSKGMQHKNIIKSYKEVLFDF